MCGHVGVAAKTLTEPMKKAFYDMLHMDVLRGDDSTGVAAISNAFTPKEEIEVFKSLGSPSEFFREHSKWMRTRDITLKPVSVLMGHNRYATQGKVTAETAHPFEFDNLVGAHNGTVTQSSLTKLYGFKNFQIDSQIIFSHLSYSGSIEEVWEEADGAMALVWWDKIDSKLNMIRNSQRPMIVAYSEDDKTILWASEMWMIMVAAMRQNIKIKDPINLKPDRLYTFDNKETGEMFHTERDLPPFVAKVRPYYQQGWYGSNYYDDWADYDPPKKVTPLVGEEVNFIITEFVNDVKTPSAIGYTAEGDLVVVNIPQRKFLEAKNKLQGRGVGLGYYVTNKMFKSALKPQQFWCPWDSLSFFKLKKGAQLLKNGENGFKLVFDTGLWAPWYEPNQLLDVKGYNHKTNCGCGSCLNIPIWADRHDLTWIDKGNFFCKECIDKAEVQEVIEFNKQKSA